MPLLQRACGDWFGTAGVRFVQMPVLPAYFGDGDHLDRTIAIS
jgi:hypothetical protein